ncbi:MAG: sulfotransferase [bacterium]|nr:sulfotransferase [bacterium]
MSHTPLRPDFLICSERSGSNLIRSIMNAHPEVYAPDPIHLTAFWDRLHEFGELEDDRNWRRLLEAIVEFYEGWMGELVPGLELNVESLAKRLESRSFIAVYEYIYGLGLEACGKSRLFLKENHTAQRADFLLRHYPDARFVFQVRDPRDYLASCKKMRGYKYGSATESTQVWRDDQQAGLRLRAVLGPEQVFALRYETLVEEPERVLRQICDFLGLAFAPEMLDFHKTEDAKRAAKRPAWRNLDKAITGSRRGRFAETLSGIEIDLVEQRVGDLMERFGYARTRPPATSLQRAALAIYTSLEPDIRRLRRGNKVHAGPAVERTIDRYSRPSTPIDIT